MPTLFERLDAGVGGTDLSVKLTVQTGELGSLATTVRALITNPPSSLGDLTASLGDLPVPDLGVGHAVRRHARRPARRGPDRHLVGDRPADARGSAGSRRRSGRS